MRSAQIAVFAYNFEHKKTQDILVRLFLEGLSPRLVLAANPVKLDILKPSIRTKLRHQGVMHPQAIAKCLDSRYQVVVHNSDDAIRFLQDESIELAVVSGARILHESVIQAVPKGIINLHPGLIPEARGLDAMLWSILNGVPLGATAHLIDASIDAGCILMTREIPVFEDDTILDLSERLLDTQLEMLRPSIELAIAGKTVPVQLTHDYNRKMTPEQEEQAMKQFPEYLRAMAIRWRTKKALEEK